jgi:hypothetical protein
MPADIDKSPNALCAPLDDILFVEVLSASIAQKIAHDRRSAARHRQVTGVAVWSDDRE